MNTEIRRIAIIGGVRIPFCRAGSHYANIGNVDLMTGALTALVGQYGLQGHLAGDVALGAVIKHTRDWNLARDEPGQRAGHQVDVAETRVVAACAAERDADAADDGDPADFSVHSCTLAPCVS